MIYNPELSSSYGVFNELSSISVPIKSGRPPNSNDYADGYVTRFFLKKINEDIIHEVSEEYINQTKNPLYAEVSIKWTICGARNNVFKNNVIDQTGVIEKNRFEIERVRKETGVDLSKRLNNLLEYWRGS